MCTRGRARCEAGRTCLTPLLIVYPKFYPPPPTPPDNVGITPLLYVVGGESHSPPPCIRPLRAAPWSWVEDTYLGLYPPLPHGLCRRAEGGASGNLHLSWALALLGGGRRAPTCVKSLQSCGRSVDSTKTDLFLYTSRFVRVSLAHGSCYSPLKTVFNTLVSERSHRIPQFLLLSKSQQPSGRQVV